MATDWRLAVAWAVEPELPQPVETLPKCLDNRGSGAPQRDPGAEPSELSPRGGEEITSRPVGGVNERPDKSSDTGPEAQRAWGRAKLTSAEIGSRFDLPTAKEKTEELCNCRSRRISFVTEDTRLLNCNVLVLPQVSDKSQ